MIGIGEAETSSRTTAYDPTCGSGSLLLKVGAEAQADITLYGQEMDSATSGLARMNMILHDYPAAVIKQGNTLANPLFKENETSLYTFDYVVANPPFSDKKWTSGVNTEKDPFGRFQHYGTPPDKQGDYAYLLHIIRSMKSTGKGACILPHGVLFRGNAEAAIRKNLIRKGYIKGIIGLPANLFYGTGIPACVLVLDKQDAPNRKGIFMIDASSGFMKDGNKNRLRERDLHRIVDTFKERDVVPGYARMVGFDEIEKNEYNLNIPRYIDSSEAEDIQDIAGHLQGGIPSADIDALQAYWEICPSLRGSLFESARDGYESLTVEKQAIKTSIYDHSEFSSFIDGMNQHFASWKNEKSTELKQLDVGCKPKQLIAELSDNLLDHYEGKPLMDHYSVFQHLMDYWVETMQDDAYLIAADGWKAETYRILVKNKSGKEQDKGWTCDLLPKDLITARYFKEELQLIADLEAEQDGIDAEITELEEEHGGEEGAFAELEKINKAEVAKRLREIKGDASAADEEKVLKQWTSLNAKLAATKKKLKEAEADLDKKAYDKYPILTETEIKVLAVDDKWLATLDAEIHGEMDRISQSLTQRVKELAERYETPLGKLTENVAELEGKVAQHLERMGFSW